MSDVIIQAKDAIESEKREIEMKALKHAMIEIEQYKAGLKQAEERYTELANKIRGGQFNHFDSRHGAICRG